jgi:hypothetical protein
MYIKKIKVSSRLSEEHDLCGLMISSLQEKTFSTGAEVAGENNIRVRSGFNVSHFLHL